MWCKRNYIYNYFDVVKIFQTIKQKEHCEDETPEIKESFWTWSITLFASIPIKGVTAENSSLEKPTVDEVTLNHPSKKLLESVQWLPHPIPPLRTCGVRLYVVKSCRRILLMYLHDVKWVYLCYSLKKLTLHVKNWIKSRPASDEISKLSSTDLTYPLR